MKKIQGKNSSVVHAVHDRQWFAFRFTKCGLMLGKDNNMKRWGKLVNKEVTCKTCLKILEKEKKKKLEECGIKKIVVLVFLIYTEIRLSIKDMQLYKKKGVKIDNGWLWKTDFRYGNIKVSLESLKACKTKAGAKNSARDFIERYFGCAHHVPVGWKVEIEFPD